tara:strand:+ start:32996 stop:34084 length:1089 start_codon:yes stop_codon:yes gene_type:complete
MKIIIKIVILLSLASCANMVPPTGGNKDLDPPKLIGKIDIENMKHVNTRIVEFEFNEFIQTNKWEEYFYISPPIENKIQKKIKGKNLSLTIEDSLTNNTTYYLSLNSCIKDINEGNILDTLSYIFSTSDNFDTLRLSGELKDAYTLKAIENAWVMLFNKDIHDSLIFNTRPNYIAKTNKDGFFHFKNLNNNIYKIVALTSFDFIYNEEEKIAFFDTIINASKDSFISLFAFDPIIFSDIEKADTILNLNSTAADTSINDTVKGQEISPGKLEILSSINSSCIIQLLQNDKLVKEVFFTNPPYIIKEIPPDKYNLKLIYDKNQDSSWTTGSWEQKIQAERVINYASEIIIRSNWDLELEWLIE